MDTSLQRSTYLIEGSKERALTRRHVLPHGVTGDGRAEDSYPVIFERARGQYLYDVDGNRFLDLHGGYGTAVLGYAHPRVDARVREAIDTGLCFVGVAHEYEARLATRLCNLLPEAERVAMCGGGGTDALYHSVRLARASTGRTKVIKVEGGYHGWHETLGASTRPASDGHGRQFPRVVSNSAGSLDASVDALVVANVNDGAGLEALFRRHTGEVAAVVVEPVIYSMGCVEVEPSFLATARALCDQEGAVLIFDEVLSGFRTTTGGAAPSSGVLPDIGTYGKAMANGYVMSVLAGKAELIDQLAPGGPVFYSGTFNGHPLGVVAAEAVLDELESDQRPLDAAVQRATRLSTSINDAAQEVGVRAICQQRGTVLALYFNSTGVYDSHDLARTLTPETVALSNDFRYWLRDNGIFMQRKLGINRCFISTVHRDEDIDQIASTVRDFFTAHSARLK